MLQTAVGILSGFLLGMSLSLFVHFQIKSKLNDEILILKLALKRLHSRIDQFNSSCAVK